MSPQAIAFPDGAEPHTSAGVSASFRDLLTAEGPRVLQFLQWQQADPALRSLAPGYSFRISMARFASLSEEHQNHILQNLDSEATSESTPDPGYIDDMYPGFEEVLSSNSGGASLDPMSNSGGASLDPMPNSGGVPLDSFTNPVEDPEVWEINSSPPLSIRAVGSVVAEGLSVEQFAEQKVRLKQLERSDVLEVIRMLWKTQQRLDAARPFQVTSEGDSTEPWRSGRWTAGAFVHGGVVGITRAARSHPWTTSFFCKALQRHTQQPVASVTVLVNCHSLTSTMMRRAKTWCGTLQRVLTLGESGFGTAACPFLQMHGHLSGLGFLTVVFQGMGIGFSLWDILPVT